MMLAQRTRSRRKFNVKFLFVAIPRILVLALYVILTIAIVLRAVLLHYPQWNVIIYQVDKDHALNLSDLSLLIVWTLFCVLSMISITQMGHIIKGIHEPMPRPLLEEGSTKWQKLVLLVVYVLVAGTFLYFIVINCYVYWYWTVKFYPSLRVFQLLPAAFLAFHGLIQLNMFRYSNCDIKMFFGVNNFMFNIVMLVHLCSFLYEGFQNREIELDNLLLACSMPFEFSHRMIALIVFAGCPAAELKRHYLNFVRALFRKPPEANRAFNVREAELESSNIINEATSTLVVSLIRYKQHSNIGDPYADEQLVINEYNPFKEPCIYQEIANPSSADYPTDCVVPQQN